MRELERRYPQELQVISVHSPKFPTERETANLRQAVLRHRIEHPVLNDADFQLWKQYDTRAWPTLFFIDPKGNVIGRHEGELTADLTGEVLDGWLAEYRRAALLTGAPLDLQRETGADSALSFPGKVEYDAAGERLFIADTNHDRIIVARLDGRLERLIGGAASGREDGPPDRATFNQPQGMALTDNALYLADLENHSIRRIDLADWQTSTVAGTGRQAQTGPQSGPALQLALNSPWDLAAHDGHLYIAMAGFHQIWTLQLESGLLGPWAGSMAEGIVDGPRRQAELAQPSGLALGPNGLTFADSESSAVRQVSFDNQSGVSTYIGKGLFAFGDADGEREQARLQHPMDVAWVPGADGEPELYVADTFNHKIKRTDPQQRRLTTLCGGLGDADGPLAAARFYEPAGLCPGPGRSLIVADTNNHRIRIVDLDAQDVRTVRLELDR